MLIQTVGQLYRELADNYGESANNYIPTDASALEFANWELELADFSADSNADPAKVGVWVWAFSYQM